MRPQKFHYDDLLSTWQECVLELRCEVCNGRSCHYPVKLLLEKIGDRPFRGVLPSLRCEDCHSPAAPVYLCASTFREPYAGCPGDWCAQLVGRPRRRA